jgi:hypothetical protein
LVYALDAIPLCNELQEVLVHTGVLLSQTLHLLDVNLLQQGRDLDALDDK